MKAKLIILLNLTSIFTFFYYEYNYTADFLNLRIMGFIGIVQLFISIWSWKELKRSIISPYIFYLLILYTFTFGQSLLYVFNYVSEQRDLIGFYGISTQDIFEAQYVTLIFLSYFHIGALLSIKKESLYYSIELIDNHLRILIKLGWVLFLISFIPFWYRLFINVIISLTFGYGALYEKMDIFGINALSQFFASYFVPAVICLYIGYKNNKKIKNIMLTILFSIIILTLLAGARSNAVILMALVVLLYHYTVRKISKKGVLLILIIGIFVLSLLSIIAQTRSNMNRNIAETFKGEITNNAVLDALAEMGGSMSTLIWTANFVPTKEDFRYGSTYLYSLSTIIPNFGFWETHPGKVNANLGEWLTNRMYLSYGTGYSMVAEAYINFGKFGWILMFFMGLLFGKILDSEDNNSLNNTLKLIFALIIFWTCASIARNSFISFVRSFFYIAFPIYIIVKHYGIKHIQKNLRNRSY